MNSENTQVEPTTDAAATSECSEAMALAAVSQEKITQLESTIQANETALTEIKASLEVLQTEKEEAAKKSKEEMDAKDEEMKKVKSELDMALEALAAYKAKEEEMVKKEKKMKRVASLVEAGVDADTATATVDKFESMDDDSFAALTVLLAAKKAAVKDDNMEEETEDAMKMTKSTETVDASVLDSVEVEEEVNLGVGGEKESAVEATRAALVEFVCSRLGKTL